MCKIHNRRIVVPMLTRGLIISAVVLGAAVQLSAQATRTWVSGVGDDANPCSRTAPCKTFAGAISKTAAGGEINVLDPGGFGALTITKAITIDATGVEAGVLVSGTNGIVVAAGTTDNVMLRGLDFVGLGTGIKGVAFLSGLTLTVENCKISGFSNRGISIESSTPNAKAFISNTLVRDQTNNGIVISPPGVTNTVVLDHVSVVNSTSVGLAANPGSVVHITNSDFSHNGNAGVQGGGASSISLETSIIASNGVGLRLLSGAATRLSNVNVVGNTTGFDTAGGVLNSFGNNQTTGNFDGVQPFVNNHLSSL
jgi:hypothetical protein